VVYTGFHEVIVSTRYISLHIANKEVQDLDLFETGRAAGRRRWRSKQQPRLRVRAPAGPPRVTFPCGRGGVLWTAWPHVAAPPHHTATPHESLVASNFACARRPAPAGRPHGPPGQFPANGGRAPRAWSAGRPGSPGLRKRRVTPALLLPFSLLWAGARPRPAPSHPVPSRSAPANPRAAAGGHGHVHRPASATCLRGGRAGCLLAAGRLDRQSTIPSLSVVASTNGSILPAALTLCVLSQARTHNFATDD